LLKNVPVEDEKRKDLIPLEVELLDDITALYHLGMSSRFKQASVHFQNQMQTIAQLEETNRRLKRAKAANEPLDHLLLSKKLFRDDLVDHIRLCAWYRVLLFSPVNDLFGFSFFLFSNLFSFFLSFCNRENKKT
jgi:Kip1 ubiquitination-promoting complex protein 1